MSGTNGVGAILFLPWIVSHPGSVSGNLARGTSKSLAQLLGTTFIDNSFGYAVETHLDAGNSIDASVIQHLSLAALLLPICLVLSILPRRMSSRLILPTGHIVAFLHVVVPYGLLFVLVQATREFASRYGFPATPSS
jgi:hypothetical protein